MTRWKSGISKTSKTHCSTPECTESTKYKRTGQQNQPKAADKITTEKLISFTAILVGMSFRWRLLYGRLRFENRRFRVWKREIRTPANITNNKQWNVVMQHVELLVCTDVNATLCITAKPKHCVNRLRVIGDKKGVISFSIINCIVD